MSYETIGILPNPPFTLDDCLSNVLAGVTSEEEKIVASFLSLPGAVRLDVPQVTHPAVYVPGTRKNSRALLVAHSDTVGKSPPSTKDLYFDGMILSTAGRMVLGADNRAGCAALWLLKEMGHSLLLVPGEESGCIGSKHVAAEHLDILMRDEHVFALQFDRRGARDMATYLCENPDWDRFLKVNYPGYRIVSGSSTDIRVLCPALGIAGANLSIGFSDEHTAQESFDLLDFYRTLLNTHTVLSRTTLPSFEYKERVTKCTYLVHDSSGGRESNTPAEKKAWASSPFPSIEKDNEDDFLAGYKDYFLEGEGMEESKTVSPGPALTIYPPGVERGEEDDYLLRITNLRIPLDYEFTLPFVRVDDVEGAEMGGNVITPYKAKTRMDPVTHLIAGERYICYDCGDPYGASVIFDYTMNCYGWAKDEFRIDTDGFVLRNIKSLMVSETGYQRIPYTVPLHHSLCPTCNSEDSLHNHKIIFPDKDSAS